jgi:hypothetical protein
MSTMCVIVSYRNRRNHALEFLRYIPPYLEAQGIDANYVFVEQADDKPFNRGKLPNAGFLLSGHLGDWFRFRDIDLMPVNAKYRRPDRPTHLATHCQQFAYEMAYPDCFGGVNLFLPEHYEQINGFSNEYWGWGGEDDDLLLRCKAAGLPIARRFSRYDSLPHARKVDPGLHKRNDARLGSFDPEGWRDEGLNSCVFQVLSFEEVRDRVHVAAVTL